MKDPVGLVDLTSVYSCFLGILLVSTASSLMSLCMEPLKSRGRLLTTHNLLSGKTQLIHENAVNCNSVTLANEKSSKELKNLIAHPGLGGG